MTAFNSVKSIKNNTQELSADIDLVEYYFERGFTDGLPVVPPIQAKIDQIVNILGGDPDWCNIMHADGAGTKSSLAYVYWKETGDISVWKGIAQDALDFHIGIFFLGSHLHVTEYDDWYLYRINYMYKYYRVVFY